jgi:hypothetical protein
MFGWMLLRQCKVYKKVLARKRSGGHPVIKRKRRKIPYMPKPEEHEGMPQHQQCPPAKHGEDKNPKHHEDEQYNYVARLLAAHPPKTVEWEDKQKCCMRP